MSQICRVMHPCCCFGFSKLPPPSTLTVILRPFVSANSSLSELESLPNELADHLIRYLTYRDVAVLTQCSRFLRSSQSAFPKLAYFRLPNVEHQYEPREGWNLLANLGRLGQTVDRLFVKVDTFKDQGWGNQKGRVLLQCCTSNQKTYSTTEPLGLAPHESNPRLEHQWLEVLPTLFKCQDESLTVFSPLDTFSVHFHIGGGGGHSLTVLRMEMLFQKDGQKGYAPLIVV